MSVLLAMVGLPVIADTLILPGLLLVGLFSLPAAIFRYRLFNIDQLISRTVSYAIITALLGGVFALLVLLPPVLLGGEEAPDYVIAAATLVVAGLFRPVRHRVQVAVDHRFNRKRYDAVHTVETFTTRLREQIDAVGTELAGVVSLTMQPGHVSLWINESKR